MDGEKIVIEKQDEADVSTNSGTSREGDVSTNSGTSREGEVAENTKPVIGVVTKVETEPEDKVGGDVEMKSECPKCHLTQVKDEGDNDNNVNGECCKCDDEGRDDSANDDTQKEARENDENPSDLSDKKKTEDLDLEDLMEVEDSWI